LILVHGDYGVLEVRAIGAEDVPVEDLKKSINEVSDLLKENADDISYFMKNCNNDNSGYQLSIHK